MRIPDKYISPFTDFGFKKLFGNEPNKDLLIDFLNELLRNETGEITQLTYLSAEQLGRSIDARKAIYDLYCENEKGEKFIVELQKAKQNYFKDRSIYYSTFPIQQQALQGDWNFKLNAVYTIGILDFVFEEDKHDHDVFHHEVQLFDKSTQKVFYDKLTYIYLEMPKFTKTETELETHFEKWLYVLKNLEDLSKRPAKLQEKIFEKLFKQAEIANYTDAEYTEYETSLKIYRDLKNSIDTAFDDGKLEGKAEGRAEGLAEGEQQALLRTAEKLKKAGVAVEIIAQTTGLSVREIKRF
ncbi:Rpn family recombination-promoting nuclease/putative transposase [Candidatus Venteria ishoeyi]|uniref:PD-(D/E)XK nuclease family transposase n=1 Tax=Candidatus Venteria ishoeyi TaxID=1899563 RepID=A0A1H6FF37_9GAMM|nr:Rpn family recombination-promoting nuclease/putative transposase [Candidatus Venteria ishoeyi]SEH08637.1 PD-(D/E)XK nuclease family transposase [Candidatus Venteria ishoeyi]